MTTAETQKKKTTLPTNTNECSLNYTNIYMYIFIPWVRGMERRWRETKGFFLLQLYPINATLRKKLT